jgi:hypothetical protein
LDDVPKTPAEPSLDVLKRYIAHLEQEIQNADFRLQYTYHVRASNADLLSKAKALAEQLGEGDAT